MSFLRYAGKQYMNASPEEQFIRWFKGTGASKALQQAMILLYKMPVKPSSLEEFFAEYLENGAQNLVKLSLLQAELCFKQAETKDVQNRIEYLRNQIQIYESQGYGKAEKSQTTLDDATITETIMTDASLPEEKGGSGLILDRFLEELEVIVEPSLENTASVFEQRVSGEIGRDEEEEEEEEVQIQVIVEIDEVEEDEDVEEGQLEMENPLEEQIEEEKPTFWREGSTLLSWKNDIIKLDPWGIVCQFKGKGDMQFLDGEDMSKPSAVKVNEDVGAGDVEPTPSKSRIDLEQRSNSSKSSNKIYQVDSDDGETLAEIYNAYVYDSIDPRTLIYPPETAEVKGDDEKLDLKFQGTMSEMMGWSNVPCTTEEQLKSAKSGKTIPKPDWSQYDTGVRDDPCLKDVDFYRDISWQDDAMKAFPINATDESFLLEYEMGRIAGRFTEKNDAGFMFEFFQAFDTADKQEKDNICGKCRKWKGDRSSKVQLDEGTTTSDLNLDMCKCGETGENCKCVYIPPKQKRPICKKRRQQTLPAKTDEDICPRPPRYYPCGCCEDCTCMCEDPCYMTWRNIPLIPGKMKNWTKDLEYPGECDFGEDGRILPKKKLSLSRNYKTLSPKNKWPEPNMIDIDAFTSASLLDMDKESVCLCIDTPPSTPNIYQDECENYCTSMVEESNATAPTLDEARQSGERRASMDPELSKAFRESGGYLEDVDKLVELRQQSIQDEIKAMEMISSIKRKSGSLSSRGPDGGIIAGVADLGEEPKYVSDAFELDLNTEVKKQFGLNEEKQEETPQKKVAPLEGKNKGKAGSGSNRGSIDPSKVPSRTKANK